MANLVLSLIISIITGAFSGTSLAEEKKVLVVGFGMHKPPYVFEKENSGLEVEIFREAARAAGYEIKSFFGPLERVKIMFIRGELDAITTTNTNEQLNFYNSEPFVEYHNYAIALKERNLKIQSINDLKDFSISSFQRARILLGDEFAKMTDNNKKYYEYADQKLRNIQLYKKRVDVIIADKRIFDYFNTQLNSSININQPITMYNLFKANPYLAAFKIENHAKDFNKGLLKIKKNGTYQKLEQKYSTYN